MLDQELKILSREAFVEKILELSQNLSDTVSWYRTILASRARGLPGCPTGDLVTRKSTSRSSSARKYAVAK